MEGGYFYTIIITSFNLQDHVTTYKLTETNGNKVCNYKHSQ